MEKWLVSAKEWTPSSANNNTVSSSCNIWLRRFPALNSVILMNSMFASVTGTSSHGYLESRPSQVRKTGDSFLNVSLSLSRRKSLKVIFVSKGNQLAESAITLQQFCVLNCLRLSGIRVCRHA